MIATLRRRHLLVPASFSVLVVGDTAALVTAEMTALTARIGAPDTAALSTSEIAGLRALLTASDIAALAAADQALAVVFLRISDTIALATSEPALIWAPERMHFYRLATARGLRAMPPADGAMLRIVADEPQP